MAMEESDPVLSKARAWREAYDEHMRWSTEQARLETELVRRIGFPGIDVDIPGKPVPAFAPDLTTLHLLLGTGPAAKDAERQLRTALRAWKAEAKQLGFVDAKKREKETGLVAERLARDALSTPASTLEGVITKLGLLIEAEAPGPEFTEEPWPSLRLVVTDLQRLAKAR
jgi:hypothetical protein